MEKVDGSMEILSAMQVTADMEGLDAQSKLILHSKEVLAIILKETVAEYKDYSKEEIMEFIEADSITGSKEVSPGRTNTTVKGDSAEFAMLNEKVSFFDLLFRAKNPELSTEDMQIDLHIDVESQKTYKPGYPIEKRGMYYLARSLSSQLTLVTNNMDYSGLEKCLSIWICRDDVPQGMRYSISTYEVVNTKNTCASSVGKENYDLMTLIVIKLGNEVYNGEEGDEGYELLRFLNVLMYPHKDNFMNTMKEYIDFSNNQELWREGDGMIGFGHTILEEGVRIGKEQSSQTIAEKDAAIAEKDIAIAEKDVAIAEKDALIAQLQRELALLKRPVAPNN